MATKLAERTRPIHAPFVAPAPIELANPQPLEATAGTRVRVHAAVATWIAGIFGLVYIAGPLAMAAVGWTAAIGSVVNNAIAFAITVPAILLFMEWQRPKMHLQRSVDPVLPVVLGSLTSWAWLHNTVGILRPFADFATGELAAFVLLNGLEFTLFAMFFSTLVRTRLGGFVLGFVFQIGYSAAFILGTALIL